MKNLLGMTHQGLGLGLMVFNATFKNSFIGGGNQSNWRKPNFEPKFSQEFLQNI